MGKGRRSGTTGLTHLPQFVEFGEVGDGQQVDVDHAEELQVLEIRGEPNDLPIVRAAVVQNQLLHLPTDTPSCHHRDAPKQAVGLKVPFTLRDMQDLKAK